MNNKMFSTDKTNYLIVDTCTLLHCGDLIATIVATIWTKRLNFVIVIPTIVIRELKGQEVCMQDKRFKIVSAFILMKRGSTTEQGKNC
jgi:hypothetical protein